MSEGASSLWSPSSPASPEASSLSLPVLFRFLFSSLSSGRLFRFPESLAGLEGAGKLNSSLPLLPLFCAFFPFPLALLDLRFFLGSRSAGVSEFLFLLARPLEPGSGESVNLEIT